jgi:glycosyltransferase involved in cell wall biosynthesis
VGVVVVNWNTRDLLARLLYGLLHVVAPGPIREIVVVDNASTDGSAEFAQELAELGAVRLIANDTQRYHGPGLTQGVNLLRDLAPEDPVDLVWVLDSDVLPLRPDALAVAVRGLANSSAIYAAERADYRPGPPELTRDRLGVCSALFDPAVVWQEGISPFREDGEPSRHLQADLVTRGHRLLAFPFCTQGYLLHLGRSTLAQVHRRDAESNVYFSWARDGHTEPHYGMSADGQAQRAAYDRAFLAAVGPDPVSATQLLGDRT